MPTVLVAENDPDIRALVVSKLEQAGFDVRAYPDGMSALAAARGNPPDVAVLDVEIPRLSGIDVCRMLRTTAGTRDVAVILLTGLVRETDVLRGLAVGADDYILKPFSPRELASRVRAVLDRAVV